MPTEPLQSYAAPVFLPTTRAVPLFGLSPFRRAAGPKDGEFHGCSGARPEAPSGIARHDEAFLPPALSLSGTGFRHDRAWRKSATARPEKSRGLPKTALHKHASHSPAGTAGIRSERESRPAARRYAHSGGANLC